MHHCCCWYILIREKRNKKATMHFSMLYLCSSQQMLLKLWTSLIRENFMQGSYFLRCAWLAQWDAMGLSIRRLGKWLESSTCTLISFQHWYWASENVFCFWWGLDFPSCAVSGGWESSLLFGGLNRHSKTWMSLPCSPLTNAPVLLRNCWLISFSCLFSPFLLRFLRVEMW